MARNSLKNVMRMIESVKENLEPENDFLHDLERTIELDAESSDYIPSRTYKPSGMNCMRASFYQITGVKLDDEPRSYVGVSICNSGTDIHERIQGYVTKMKDFGMDCEYVNVADFVKQRNLDYLDIKGQQGMETKLYHKDLNMSFLCDGIIKYKGKYYILELKTETTNKFWNRQDIDKGHYNQATAYSIALGLDNVLFVYINRDCLQMKSFMLNVTDEMKQNLIGYIEECDEYINKLKVPPKQDNKKVCQYCGYKTQCGKDL